MLVHSAKRVINGMLRRVGLQVINANWGPRGFATTLKQLGRWGETPQVVIDIGAATGTWCRECLQVLPDAEYFLIDPLAENQPHLEALADQYPSVSYWLGGVGASPGQQAIWVHGDQSSFHQSEYSRGAAAACTEIEVRTLDSFLESGQIRPPNFIKADVQGYELEVLQGARMCLQHARMLLLELSIQEIYDGSPLAHEVISDAGKHGFRVYDICSYAQRPRDGQLAQCDVMFLRADSPAFQYRGWA